MEKFKHILLLVLRIITIVLLPGLVILASLYTAFASNFFFEDILNIEVLFGARSTFLITIPVLLLAVNMVLALFYLYRFARYHKVIKTLSLVYFIIALAINFAGVITSIIGPIVVYGTLFGKYPYPGHCFIVLLLHIVLMLVDILAIVIVVIFFKNKEKHKISVGYCFATFGWFMFLCLVMNRFGTFLISPTFISWRTLYMTWPFYLFLAVPSLLFVYKTLVDFGLVKNKIIKIVILSVISVLVLAFGLATTIIGFLSPVFVSAVSVSMPLERLAAKPVELPIHLASYLAVIIVFFVYIFKGKKKEVK